MRAFCAKADTANAGTRKLWEKRQESGQKEIACARARVLCIEARGGGLRRDGEGSPKTKSRANRRGNAGILRRKKFSMSP